ncbi:unnamed protein product [Xylocopa violacea]|uniref:Uncharacterized protein n=1 Tax=Xylocopa violacea TaxID=135666 RepID=A0ABP1MY52_XYLVO
MTERLAAKHTNSVALKKNILLTKDSKVRRCCPYSRPYRLAIFCVTACCIFLIYWLIVTPLLMNVFIDYRSTKIVWLVLYWLIAFLIWLLIMLCFYLIWRCTEKQCNGNPALQSYGTNDSPKLPLVTTKQDHSDNLKPKGVKQDGLPNDFISDKPSTNTSDESRPGKIKKHKDLPPLVIHRRNSGNDIERVGSVSVKENVDAENKENEDYLKLVTITPQSGNDTKSPKQSLSPREMFFIELIKEAEKAEKNKESNPQDAEGKHFFPHDFSPTKKNINEDVKEKKPGGTSAKSKEPEATYFIADVGSPKKEKTEVFLDIAPNAEPVKDLSADLNSEKPILVLKNKSADEETKNLEEKVVLFEI